MPLAAIFAAGGPPRPKPKPEKRAKRTKRAAGRDLPQPSRASAPQLVDGRIAIEVTLTGVNGEGRRMILDEWQWPRIKLAFGEFWTLAAVGKHRYVIALGAHAGMRLARWIAGAGWGQVVSYKNGNTLDLRAANLIIMDAREFVAGAFGHA